MTDNEHTSTLSNPAYLNSSALAVLVSDLPSNAKKKLREELGCSEKTLHRRLSVNGSFNEREIAICRAFLEEYAVAELDIEYLLSPMVERVS